MSTVVSLRRFALILARMRSVSAMVGLLAFATMLPGQSPKGSADNTPAVKQNTLTPDSLPAALFPKCKTYAYTPVPQPDLVADLMSKHKRYRLVIGVGQFKEGVPPPLEFVDPTVELVDKGLSQLGFASLPSLKDRPFLAGRSATKDAIKDALLQMVIALSPDDLGLIYYVGHGIPTLDNKDLSLAVYDRPVGPDEGLRFSDILGLLVLSETRKQITQIPHIIIVLDSCFSGNIAIGPSTQIQTKNNLQRVVEIENAIVPDKITVLTATADGDNARAFELTGAKVSAYGYFFARALNEDWACADEDSPDGIMTLAELNEYLRKRLALAHDNNQMEGSMTPQILEREKKVFIAYSPDYHAVDGARDQIIALPLELPKGETTTVAFADGRPYRCLSSCVIPVSRSFQGPVTIGRFLKGDEGGELGIAPPPDKLIKTETVTFSELAARGQGSVAGISVAIISAPASSKNKRLASQPNVHPEPNEF